MQNKINEYLGFSKDNPFNSQIKMFCHYDRLYEYFKYGDTYPIFMEINLTDKCNLECEWCISDNRTYTDTLDTATLKTFMKDFKKCGGKAITFSGGGEPTLHKDFTELVNYAKKIGLELGLMTNGFFSKKLVPIIGDNFKWCRISLDTVNKEKYLKWKKKDAVDRILDNIKELYKYPLKLGVNCNVSMEMSVEDIENLINTTINMCEYLQFRPILPRFFKDEEIKLNMDVWNHLEKYKDNSKINFSYDKFKDLSSNNFFPFESCEGHYFSPILNANGDICVCMYHPNDSRFVFGNINENNFIDIWNSKERTEKIDNLRKLDYYNECQVCCKLFELNKLVEFIKNPNPNSDINFL